MYICKMKEKRVIHIYIKQTGEHYYYTSLAIAIQNIHYDLRIAARSVRNYMSVNKTNVFENDYCVIRVATLYANSYNTKKL
jgi:hypothetical protein